MILLVQIVIEEEWLEIKIQTIIVNWKCLAEFLPKLDTLRLSLL